MRYLTFFALSSMLFLSACAEAELAAHVAKKIPGMSSKSEGTFKVGNRYKIKGKYYYPEESYTLDETGIASWYGPNFHGKKTANGERFDQYELTAAHRTLQMPSLVRVTNLENGRSLVLRVNDRGPFARGRIIDVSKRGAELLGFKNQGTAKVRVQVLAEESRAVAEAARRGEDTSGVEIAMNERPRNVPARTPVRTAPEPIQNPNLQQASLEPVQSTTLKPTSSIHGHRVDGRFYPDPIVKTMPVAPTNIFVQAGSFGSEANARALAQKLAVYGKTDIYPAVVNGRTFYRVRFPTANVSTADQILATLERSGNSDAIIVVE